MTFLILGGAFMLGICIFIHELGHYLCGLLVGVKAEIFSIGYGKGIWKKKIGVTTWQITAFPFGGYVKFYGDDFQDPDNKSVPGGFLAVHPLKRIIPVLGGPLFNLFLGFAVFLLLHSLSGPLAPRVQLWESQSETPAMRDGLQNGDVVLAIDGTDIKSFYDIQKITALSSGNPLDFKIEREGQVQNLTVTPEVLPSGTARIGLRPPGPSYLEVDYAFGDKWSYWISNLFSNNPPPTGLKALPYLKDGDVILSVAGVETSSVLELQKLLGRYQGQTVPVKVRRESMPWLAPWITREEVVQIPVSSAEYRLMLTDVVDLKYNAPVSDQVLYSHVPDNQRALGDLSFDNQPAGSFKRVAERFPAPRRVQVGVGDRTYTATVAAVPIGLFGFPPGRRIESEYLPTHDTFTDVLAAAYRDTVDNIMIYPAFFGKLFSGRISFYDNAMGPVGMMGVAGVVAKAGFQQYLHLIAAISIALMVMNLLPFPVVDGGHIVFFLYEAIAGRPIPLHIMEAIYKFGLSVLLFLGLLIMYKDTLLLLSF